MITLKKLTLKAFRSFQEETTIVFPDNGFILIDGHNEDTGGSSGSGKTSIVEAVAFALGYAKLPATELQNRNTKDKLQVKLTVSTPQGDVEIARGKETYVEYLGTPRIIRGSVPVQEELDKLLGLPTDLIEALTYRPQRSFGRFISMTDSEKKEFLTNCLPELEEIEKVAEQARQEQDKFVTQLQQAEFKVTTLLEEFARHFQNDPSTQLKPIDIRTLSGKIAVLEQEWADLSLASAEAFNALEKLKGIQGTESATYAVQIQHEVKAELDALDQTRKQQTDTVAGLNAIVGVAEGLVKFRKQELQSALDAQRANTNALRSKLRELLSAYATKPDIERRLSTLESEIHTLKSNICPTCQREWLENQTKLQDLQAEMDRMAQKLTVLDAIKTKIDELEGQIQTEEQRKPSTAELEQAEAQLLSATYKFADAQAQIQVTDGKKSQVMATVEAKRRTKEAELATQMGALSGAYDLAEAAAKSKAMEHSRSISDLANAKLQNANIQEQIARYQATIKSVGDMLKVAQNEVPALKAQANLEGVVHTVLGRQGYLGSIFDEILSEIGREVTEVLARVPNVSTLSLQFVSESETKKGSLKRSIVPVVTKDGVPASFASLSGGQQSSVELAVDLAIGNVIGRRTGRTPGWIVLDEAMDGQDLPAKESCMEILKRYAADRLIIMVDHSSELKEAFSQTINVVMKSGASSVQP